MNVCEDVSTALTSFVPLNMTKPRIECALSPRHDKARIVKKHSLCTTEHDMTKPCIECALSPPHDKACIVKKHSLCTIAHGMTKPALSKKAFAVHHYARHDKACHPEHKALSS